MPASVPYSSVFAASTTPGTVAFVLNGPVTRVPNLGLTLVSGDQVFYLARDLATNQWEKGVGTLTGTPPTTLTRTTVLANSLGTTAPISWGIGEREITLDHVAIGGSQPATGNTHTVTAGATVTVFTNTTFDGSVGTTAYTVGDIVAALKAHGLINN